jgi:hypothetical protein
MKASADNYITSCDATSYDEGEESAAPETIEGEDVIPDVEVEEDLSADGGEEEAVQEEDNN